MFIYNKENDSFFAATGKLSCEIIRQGASIFRVNTPDKHGIFKNVALTLTDASRYGDDPSYAGATLAPCTGRIRRGRLCILNHEYQLDINDGRNHLHGGKYSGSNRSWSVDSCNDTVTGQEIILSLDLPDGFCGYPGNRHFTTSYLLNNNILKINYKATTDRPTWVSMSNHAYWNLSGDFTRSALDHTLQIRSDRVVFNDAEHLPSEICMVNNTPFDFRKPVKISDNIKTEPLHKQLKNALGYNNAYLLGRDKLPCAVLSDPDSGRFLRIYTDQPALVFYSGGYLDSQTQLKDGLSAASSCALALEAQDLPDAPNFSGKAFHILMPGETWHHEIVYKFDCVASL